MKSNEKFFKHESNARNDEKLLAVRIRHGMEGYGVYWAIMEILRDANNYTIKQDYQSISWELHISEELIKTIVEDFGLFDVQDGMIKSVKLCCEMEEADRRKEARRKSGILGMQSRWGNKNNADEKKTATPKKKRTQSDSNNITQNCRSIFESLFEQYKGVKYYWKAKDAVSLKRVIQQIQFHMTDEERQDQNKVEQYFSIFIKRCMTECDNWTKENISLTLIDSRFNVIYSMLKNKKNGTKQQSGAEQRLHNVHTFTNTEVISDIR